MDYLVEVYVSRCDSDGARSAAELARSAAEQLTREGTPVRLVRALFLPEEETCLHLYEADSPQAASAASRRAGIPFQRVTEAVEITGGARDAVE